MGLQELEALVHRTATAGEPFERGADEAEQAYLSSLAARPSTKLICEIGFNAGFSSWAFLDASPDTTVVSFDLAAYAYSDAAKAHIDEHFPGRHTLIQGDSHTTIAAYAKEHPDMRFDVIFIDGDHSVEGARADLDDLRALATAESVVIMDDITPWLWFGEGPTQAWQDAVEEGRILHTQYFRDGEPVDAVTPPAARAWAEGRYPF
ncbi:class I SAM-dependent methyltransferase [Rhodococcus sp. 14-1411-2a]|uniref:class I SAM-dependent methyltransferase n=1 Tax=Rhodococcus sp. 14-1411-2a TaxID=2023151 RepID=UPI000B9B4897|nr:class I SAM-dependent methyltransferase [Rhodococcus sp. 14-1411-2a]OZF47018.1 methyltransferase [Rhodococcus sp. 14-1411-2a]